MGIKHIILHVGMHKTGTTSIQETLYMTSNRNILQGKGILYLSEWGANHSVTAVNLFSEDPEQYIWNLVKGYDIHKINQINLVSIESLKEAALNSSCDTLLISGEDIGTLSNGELRKMKDFFVDIFGAVDFRIITYLRNPLALFISALQTLILCGLTRETYQNHKISIYFREVIEKLFDVFGRDSVEVYQFESACNEPFRGPVEHFLNILGFSEKEINMVTITKANESASQIAVEMFNYFNEKVPLFIDSPSGKILNPIRETYDFYRVLELKGPKFDFSYNQKVQFLKQYSQQLIENNQWLKVNTGIDYMPFLQDTKDKIIEFDSHTINDLENIFYKLNDESRQLFIEFLENKYSDSRDIELELLIKKIKIATRLLEEFNKEFEDNGFLINEMQGDFTQLFVDNGTGFCEDNSTRYPISQQKLVKIDLNLNLADNITSFRIDPSVISCVVLLDELLVNGKSDNCQIAGSNCFENKGKLYVFLKDDPQIYITSNEQIYSISLKMIVIAFQFSDKKYMFKMLTNKIAEYEEKINSLEHKNEALQKKQVELILCKNKLSYSMKAKIKSLRECFIKIMRH